MAVIIPASAYPQWLDQVRTESDWELLYNQGYFDYNTFQLYRELAEGATVGDSIDFIRAAQGNSVIEVLGESGEGAPAVSDTDSTGRPTWNMRVRSGQRIESGGRNNAYVSLSGDGEEATFELKGRKAEGESTRSSWEIERRSIKWGRGRSIVTLGNYDTDIGLGLAIGRFDYRPISGIPDSPQQPDDIVFPDNSYYNGIKIDYDRSSAMFSAKRYPGLDKRFIGASMSAYYNEMTIGVSGACTFLSADGYDKSLGVASFFFTDPTRGIRSELAYAESGIGAAMRLKRDGFDLGAWHYDNSFLNLQSSGIARPDYDRFEDPHFPEAFRQAQAGETGLYAQKELTVGRFDLGAATEIWKASLHDRVSLDNLLSARCRLGDGVTLDARLSGRTGLSNDRVITELGSSLNGMINIHARVSAWNERGEMIDSRSYCYIFCSLPIKAKILLAGRLRSYFDGDLDYFIEEALVVVEGLRIKATYRWQESYHGEIGPLYLVLEAAI